MAETVYNAFKAGLARGEQDWVNDEHRALLLTGAVTIDPDHATVAAVLAANTEADDASYARETLVSEAVAQDDANNRANLDAATLDFGALDAETPTAVLIFQFITSDALSIPISIHDSGFGVAANGAGYTVTVPNDVVRIT
jgi:hypothetical protein